MEEKDEVKQNMEVRAHCVPLSRILPPTRIALPAYPFLLIIMGATWATPEQLKLLKSLRPAYRKYRAEGSVSFFWPEMTNAWFAVYPDRTYDNGLSWETVRILVSICIREAYSLTHTFSVSKIGFVTMARRPTATTTFNSLCRRAGPEWSTSTRVTAS